MGTGGDFLLAMTTTQSLFAATTEASPPLPHVTQQANPKQTNHELRAGSDGKRIPSTLDVTSGAKDKIKVFLFGGNDLNFIMAQQINQNVVTCEERV